MVTLRAITPLSLLRFAGKVDRESSLGNQAPMTLSGVKDPVDTFLRMQAGLPRYDAVGPDIQFTIDRPDLAPPDSVNVEQKGLTPFSLAINVLDKVTTPQVVELGYAVDRTTQHTTRLTAKLFERKGRLYRPETDDPANTNVVAFDGALMRGLINMALTRANRVRSEKTGERFVLPDIL